MRELTEQQARALDRICAAQSSEHARVVGWLLGGPVISLRNDRLIHMRADGQVREVTIGA